MKKFYSTLVLAAAVAFSVSAAGFKGEKAGLQKMQKVSALTEMVQSEAAPLAQMKAAPVVAKAAPTKVEEVYGYYELIFNRWTEQPVPPLPLSIYPSSAPDAVANQVTIVGWAFVGDIEAIFDPEKKTLTVPAGQVAIPSDYTKEGNEVYLTNVVLKNPEGSTFNEVFDFLPNDPIVLQFTENGGFQSVSDKHGFAYWCKDGIYGVAVPFVASRLAAPTLEGWEDLGQATFTDGWYNPGIMCIGFEEANILPAFDVKLQRSEANPYLFRLYDPYGDYNTYLNTSLGMPQDQTIDCNYSMEAGCIEFDLTDFSCVLVKPDVYSGFDDGIFGIGMLYASNAAGKFVYRDGPLEEPDASKADLIEAWKSFVDSPEQLSTYDSATNTVIINDAEVDFQSADFLTWNEFAERIVAYNPPSEVAGLIPLMPISMTAVIQLPETVGINNVITDNSNNTLEYFNLQGVRVNNPSNGIYIRRQGNDVQKVYVR